MSCHGTATNRLLKPKRNAPHFAGRLGVQGGEIYVMCLWEVGRPLRRLRGR
jgi:hypothetical protein